MSHFQETDLGAFWGPGGPKLIFEGDVSWFLERRLPANVLHKLQCASKSDDGDKDGYMFKEQPANIHI